MGDQLVSPGPVRGPHHQKHTGCRWASPGCSSWPASKNRQGEGHTTHTHTHPPPGSPACALLQLHCWCWTVAWSATLDAALVGGPGDERSLWRNALLSVHGASLLGRSRFSQAAADRAGRLGRIQLVNRRPMLVGVAALWSSASFPLSPPVRPLRNQNVAGLLAPAGLARPRVSPHPAGQWAGQCRTVGPTGGAPLFCCAVGPMRLGIFTSRRAAAVGAGGTELLARAVAAHAEWGQSKAITGGAVPCAQVRSRTVTRDTCRHTRQALAVTSGTSGQCNVHPTYVQSPSHVHRRAAMP